MRQASLWVHLARVEPWRGLTAGATNVRRWTESSLSWRARPAVGLSTGKAGPAIGRLWKKIDVTPLARQNGTVDIALTTASATGLELSSREAARKLAPRLHLLVVPDEQPGFPVRGAFYSAKYPAGWGAGTQYHPTAGRYDGSSASVIGAQLSGLSYGRFNAAIVPWSGPKTASDARDTELLNVTDFLGSPVKWAFQPKLELLGDPSSARVASTLAALDIAHGRDPAYLRVRGRPVIFIPVEAEDSCDAVARWVKGNVNSRFYLVFAAVPNFGTCASKPSDWYRVDPSARAMATASSSIVVEPGEFDASTARAKLNRDLSDFAGAVRFMGATRKRFQLVRSYDGWADGTALEPASEWASPSGYGQYLDVLHTGGQLPATPPVTVDAAGDIACGIGDIQNPGVTHDTCQNGATAQLIGGLQPDAVLPLGDDQYPQGELRRLPGRRTTRVGAGSRPSPTPPWATTSTARPGADPPARPWRATSPISALRRASRAGLVLLRPRLLARHRAQLRLRAHRRMRAGVPRGGLAARRPRRAPGALHARLLAPPALLLRPEGGGGLDGQIWTDLDAAGVDSC